MGFRSLSLSILFCSLAAHSSSVCAEEMWRYLNGSNASIPGNSDIKALFTEYDAQPDYVNKVSIDGKEGIHLKTRNIIVLNSGKSFIAESNNTSYLIECVTKKVYYVQKKTWGKPPFGAGMIDYMCPLME